MDQPSGPNEKPFEKSEERVIRGAEAIAEFIFGSHRRKVYYLAECSKIPIHRPRKHALPATVGVQKLDRKSGTSRCHECEARRRRGGRGSFFN